MRRTSGGDAPGCGHGGEVCVGVASIFITAVTGTRLFALLVLSFAQIFTQCLGQTLFALLLFERSRRRHRRVFFVFRFSVHPRLFSMLSTRPGLLLPGSQYAMFPAIIRRRSSVVERALGKGEVGCSIHPGGTSFLASFPEFNLNVVKRDSPCLRRSTRRGRASKVAGNQASEGVVRCRSGAW